MRAEADLRLFPEKLAQEELDRALQVGQGNVRGVVHVEALDLVELREVRGVRFVAAVGGAGGDDPHRWRLRFHGADLHR